MIFERLRTVDVRAVLAALRPGERATFQLRPRVFIGGRWQGGTFMGVLRNPHRTGRLFKIGCLDWMNTEAAVSFVNTAFDGYHAPRV